MGRLHILPIKTAQSQLHDSMFTFLAYVVLTDAPNMVNIYRDTAKAGGIQAASAVSKSSSALWSTSASSGRLCSHFRFDRRKL